MPSRTFNLYMDADTQRKFARAMCEVNRTRREYVALKRRYNLVSRRVSRPAGSSESDGSACASPFQGTPRRVGESQRNVYLDEMGELASVPSRRRYTPRFIAMAFSVFLLSTAAYLHLRNFLPLPSKQTLYAQMGACIRLNVTLLQDASKLPDVIECYKQENEISQTRTISGVLAVDAISFRRELVITNTGVVQGSLSNETVDQELLAQLHSSFSEFENYYREHHSALISDAFVFQFQPLNASLKSLVVHVTPSSQGKATEKTVELLDEISSRLRDVNFDVIAYAMDGDTTYSKLHRNFYAQYSGVIVNDPKFMFANFSTIPRKMVISDPLHLLKRARYRLLGAQVHVGITGTSPLINISVLKKLLSLPSKVFLDQKFTKMHDDLAISMFSLTSLVELFEKKMEYVPYFLPFCLLNAAISEKELSVEERASFLEVCLYYMMAYVQELPVAPVKLPDHKAGKRVDVRPFSANLAVEFCNTAVSLLSILSGINGSVNLNRAGTNPLEHTFGSIRMRSRYKHTYDSMVRSLGATETWKRLVSSLGVGAKVSGRKTYYGQTVTRGPDRRRNILGLDARDIAIALHVAFGFPISSLEMESWNMNYVVSQNAKIVNNFQTTIATIHRRLHAEAKPVTLNSRTICVTAGSNLCMIKQERELANLLP